MGLHVKKEEVVGRASHPVQVEEGLPGPKMYMVHGPTASMVIGERPPGYHSSPHIHDREQYNYSIKGDHWLFIDGTGYFVKEGDFTRIPANAVHWAWNNTDETAISVEFHAPGQQDLDMLEGESVPMFADGESTDHVPSPPTIFVDEKEARREEVEAAALAQYEASRGKA